MFSLSKQRRGLGTYCKTGFLYCGPVCLACPCLGELQAHPYTMRCSHFLPLCSLYRATKQSNFSTGVDDITFTVDFAQVMIWIYRNRATVFIDAYK